MLSIVLNIIGITLVLYSIYVIRKDIAEKRISEEKLVELEEIKKEYYEYTKDSIEDFEFIIDSKTQISDLSNNQSGKESEINKTNKKTNSIIKDERVIPESNHINPLHKKIIELESIGLTNEEIAKKLGRGIREIDIVLKIYKK